MARGTPRPLILHLPYPKAWEEEAIKRWEDELIREAEQDFEDKPFTGIDWVVKEEIGITIINTSAIKKLSLASGWDVIGSDDEYDSYK